MREKYTKKNMRIWLGFIRPAENRQKGSKVIDKRRAKFYDEFVKRINALNRTRFHASPLSESRRSCKTAARRGEIIPCEQLERKAEVVRDGSLRYRVTLSGAAAPGGG